MTQHLRRQKVKPKEIQPLTSMFNMGHRIGPSWYDEYLKNVASVFMGFSIRSNPHLPEGTIIMEMKPRKMEERLNAYLIKTKEACK